MRMSFFETEKSSSEPGGCRGLEKLLQKNLKKVLDKANEFDKINEVADRENSKEVRKSFKKN